MTYDCMIIGGGLAGLTCAIKCASEGLRTAVITGGMNALHFSSGSIDVLGYYKGRRVEAPFKKLADLVKSSPNHPYSRVGIKTVREALAFFKNETAAAGLSFYDNGEENHFRVTSLGASKPTYFSQITVFNERLKQAIEKKAKITLLNFDGYRDYFAELTAGQMRHNPLFRDVEIRIKSITLPFYTRTEKNLHEFRSIDLARVFDTERYLPRIADEIKKCAGDSEIVSLPAFIGIDHFKKIHRRLEEMTGKLIYEIPSLPPSILGMRIDNALKARLAALGGEFSAGDKITGGEIAGGSLDHVHTENYGDTRHRARFYVLATGSFFSGGLRSAFDRIEEPILNLSVTANQDRSSWYSERFLGPKGHPFLQFGVTTNRSLNPLDASGKPVNNLFCAGAMLAGYDPVREGSGGGVAISTGYHAAKRIISETKKA